MLGRSSTVAPRCRRKIERVPMTGTDVLPPADAVVVAEVVRDLPERVLVEIPAHGIVFDVAFAGDRGGGDPCGLRGCIREDPENVVVKVAEGHNSPLRSFARYCRRARQ